MKIEILDWFYFKKDHKYLIHFKIEKHLIHSITSGIKYYKKLVEIHSIQYDHYEYLLKNIYF